MGTMHIRCDKCGKEWDTEKRWNEGPLGAAARAGWRIGVRDGANQVTGDFCPQCSATIPWDCPVCHRPVSDEYSRRRLLDGLAVLKAYGVMDPGGVEIMRDGRQLTPRLRLGGHCDQCDIDKISRYIERNGAAT